MTTQEISAMIGEIGIPYAYDHFTKETAKPCPFICFFYAGSDDMAADNVNHARIERLIVELYCDNKDFALEKTVQDTLNSHGLFFTRSEMYIDSEQMYETIYESEVIING